MGLNLWVFQILESGTSEKYDPFSIEETSKYQIKLLLLFIRELLYILN